MTCLSHSPEIEEQMTNVRTLIASAVTDSSIADLADDLVPILACGKMLRSRLAISIGHVTDAQPSDLAGAAAAVELIHAGSLLHDDVIDGGVLRRGAPSFWKAKGVSGAILLGDHLIARAFRVVNDTGNPQLITRLIHAAADICDAEVNQELMLRDTPADWDMSVNIARRKTGALFAFSGFAAGGTDSQLSEELFRAAEAAGTAYQLADDVLDMRGGDAYCDKSLGNDAAAGKVTAAAAADRVGIDVTHKIRELYVAAQERLDPWPHVAAAWKQYMNACLEPAIDQCLGEPQDRTTA